MVGSARHADAKTIDQPQARKSRFASKWRLRARMRAKVDSVGLKHSDVSSCSTCGRPFLPGVRIGARPPDAGLPSRGGNSVATVCVRRRMRAIRVCVCARTNKGVVAELVPLKPATPSSGVLPSAIVLTPPDPRPKAQQFLDAANGEYERVHLAFEEQFWGTKMNLKDLLGPAYRLAIS